MLRANALHCGAHKMCVHVCVCVYACVVVVVCGGGYALEQVHTGGPEEAGRVAHAMASSRRCGRRRSRVVAEGQGACTGASRACSGSPLMTMMGRVACALLPVRGAGGTGAQEGAWAALASQQATTQAAPHA